MKKLLQTLFDKEKYVVHYKLLKLYVDLGLIVKKLYRVLQFRQDQRLAPYISLNCQKRQLASNKVEENFYKLRNNGVYGKNCESKRHRNKLVNSRDAESKLSTISKFEFERYFIFGENLAALSTRPKNIYWNTPTIVGASILDLAKYQMYHFRFKVIRPNFECRLLYSDTDSLLYSVKCADFYQELSKKPQAVLDCFDFSN